LSKWFRHLQTISSQTKQYPDRKSHHQFDPKKKNIK
jgi:hypothetical protein